MKITPLEIRQKTFEKIFRGYDKDEVSAYLQSLSHEWEKMLDEQKELKIKMEATEREMAKLREVETSLYKTLKTAEDTGANMIQQANKAAELRLKETEMKADNILQAAKVKSKEIIETTGAQAKEIIANMLDEIKILEHNFNLALSQKESLVTDLRNLSNETLERVKKFTERKEALNIDKYMKAAREFANNYDLKNFDVREEDFADELERKAEEKIKAENHNPAPSVNDDQSDKSFFDLID